MHQATKKNTSLLPIGTTVEKNECTYIRSQNYSRVEFQSGLVLLVNLLLAFRAHFTFRLETEDVITGEGTS